ncbi:MAG: hypothetical protein KDI01_12000 [Halioglobus sp.]|nr:hypothetical protein [Halioglobus sp.]
MPDFTLTYIGPKRKKLFFRSRFESQLKKLYDDTGNTIKKKMEEPFGTADHGLPNIDTKLTDEGVEVSTTDERWVYNALGTSLRWAVMSSDFSPKTTPNSLNASRGSGRTVIRGRMAMIRKGMSPRPGIEARNWHVIIAQDVDSDFKKQYKSLLLKTLWV